MSAICGAVSLNGKKIGAKECSILKSAFSDCVIDRWEEIKEDDIYMGVRNTVFYQRSCK